MSTVPVRRIVNVDVLVAAAAPSSPVFSRTLCVGSSSKLPTYDRLRLYGGTDEVAADFETTDEEYLYALVHFAQVPKPAELMIGRRLTSAWAAGLKSGLRETALASYTAITSGGFGISVDGVDYDVDGVDLSSCTDMADVAAAVQARLRAETGAAETVVFDETTSNFIITSVVTGVGSVVDYATVPAYPVTDLATVMGLTKVKGAQKIAGGAAEDVLDSLEALRQADGSWYGFHFTKEVDDESDLVDASVWADANEKFHLMTYAQPAAYDPASAADLGSLLKAAGIVHALVQFSSTTDYAAASAGARLLQVKYDQINSTITLEFKQEPGVAPENLTTTQYEALEAKNYCYLATVSNGFVMIFNSKTPSGRFADEIVNVDWFKADMQNQVFTALATTPTKIPQTDKGVEMLVQAASKTCEKAVRNRMAAPGTWTHDGFGALETGDFVQQGYYLYAPPVSSQTEADRGARTAPPIQGALCGAGAFHNVDITFNFQR